MAATDKHHDVPQEDRMHATNDTEQLHGDSPATEDTERRALSGPIVWGTILVIIAALYAVQVAVDLGAIGGIDISPAWIVLGLGGLLVVGGLAAALTRRR
ncbi:hypothetical protein [Salinibacterium sp. GXW1014]|uniref:hypothetical protein n=1 Tax=Salinibacterium sp. GXW1014 TaxID=3377838 RepID=UPI00383AC55E